MLLAFFESVAFVYCWQRVSWDDGNWHGVVQLFKSICWEQPVHSHKARAIRFNQLVNVSPENDYKTHTSGSNRVLFEEFGLLAISFRI